MAPIFYQFSENYSTWLTKHLRREGALSKLFEKLIWSTWQDKQISKQAFVPRVTDAVSHENKRRRARSLWLHITTGEKKA